MHIEGINNVKTTTNLWTKFVVPSTGSTIQVGASVNSTWLTLSPDDDSSPISLKTECTKTSQFNMADTVTLRWLFPYYAENRMYTNQSVQHGWHCHLMTILCLLAWKRNAQKPVSSTWLTLSPDDDSLPISLKTECTKTSQFNMADTVKWWRFFAY